MAEKALIKYPLSFLHVIGFHPHKQNAFSRLRLLIVLFVTVFGNSLIAILLIFNITDLAVIGEALGNWPILYQTMFKMAAMLYNIKSYSSALRDLQKFWSFDQQQRTLGTDIKNAQKGSWKLFNVFKMIIFGIGTTYLLRPIMQRKRELPAVWYDFCDLRGNLCFAASVVCQTLNTISLCCCNVGFDGIYFMLLMYVYCDLKLINQQLLNLDLMGGRSEKKLLAHFYVLVDHHSFVLNFIKKINKIYAILIFNQYYANMFTICTGLLMLSMINGTVNFYKCIAFIVVSVMELAIYCVGGQYIVNQAAAVADAAFDCKWPDKYHKHLWNGLRMVIRRAQTSESITIGNLRTLDLESYKDALTNSVTYFTILKTLYSADSK